MVIIARPGIPADDGRQDPADPRHTAPGLLRLVKSVAARDEMTHGKSEGVTSIREASRDHHVRIRQDVLGMLVRGYDLPQAIVSPVARTRCDCGGVGAATRTDCLDLHGTHVRRRSRLARRHCDGPGLRLGPVSATADSAWWYTTPGCSVVFRPGAGSRRATASADAAANTLRTRAGTWNSAESIVQWTISVPWLRGGSIPYSPGNRGGCVERVRACRREPCSFPCPSQRRGRRRSPACRSSPAPHGPVSVAARRAARRASRRGGWRRASRCCRSGRTAARPRRDRPRSLRGRGSRARSRSPGST